MFSIEHEFDSTLITLVDEGTAQLQEDLIVNSFSKCITIEQYDVRTDKINKIIFSMAQLKDLSAAINLPEGVYTRLHKENFK
jgi:histidinol dehydrogenase